MLDILTWNGLALSALKKERITCPEATGVSRRSVSAVSALGAGIISVVTSRNAGPATVSAGQADTTPV
jgi:hypothetical protein